MKGVALWEEEGNEPVMEIDLCLAEVSEVVEGRISLAKLDPASSPKAAPYDNGALVFNEIPPGDYALMAYISPADSVVIPNPESGKDPKPRPT